MISPRSIFAVFRFELRQAATIPRMAWWLALALFPFALSLLLQWAAGEHSAEESPTSSVVRIEVSKFSKGGLPTLDVDGKTLKGLRASAYVNGLGVSRLKGNVADTLSQLGVSRQRNRRRQPQPILVVQYPAEMSRDDQRLKIADELFRDAFSEVIFYPAGETAPVVEPPSRESLFWGAGLFILLPSVVAMLATFLWSAPAVASELEGRSWAYIATRPHGPVSVLLGKYAIGVLWGMSAAITALVLSLSVAHVPEGFMYLFKPLAILIVLACPAYGAIYALIGAIAPRRAMVVSVAYTLTLEALISVLPAMGAPALISRVTVQYPLRTMMVRWLRIDEIPEGVTQLSRFVVTDSSMVVDVASILMVTIIVLTGAVLVLRYQELSQADESDS